MLLWRRGSVVNTTVQLHLKQPEFRFSAGSNPVRGVSEIGDGYLLLFIVIALFKVGVQT